MTGDLLQADVDLARRLLLSGESDERVIETLCLRRVDPAKARDAVRDLKAGWDVRGEDLDDPDAFAVTIQPVQNAQPETKEQRGPEPEERRQPEQWRESKRDAHSSKRRGSGWIWLGLILVCGGMVTIWLLKNQQTRIHATSRETIAVPEPKLSVPAPILRRQRSNLRVDGGKLSLGGVALKSGEAFTRLNEIIGNPSRTNHVEGMVLYTYDDHGMVLYSSEKGGKDSLVVYLEAIGGANGVQKAYSGALSIEGKMILASMDRTEISTIPNLGLKETVTNVFAGQSGGLAINFAYLKSADRLSMVQIDLN